MTRHPWEHLTLLEEKDTYLSQRRYLRASVVDNIRNSCLFLLPSFVVSNASSKQLRDTAFLDGARGIAAWSVFNAHLSALLIKTGGAAFGQEGYELWKLPGFRIFYSGHFAVAVFFIISGYALSIGVVAATRTPSDPYFRKFAATILRRPLRLYLAPLISLMIPFVLIRYDVFNHFRIRNATQDPHYIDGWDALKEWPARTDTFWEQLCGLAEDVRAFFHIMKASQDGDFGLRYNGVLWTVKVELRGSLVLYLIHAALFFVRRQVRLYATIGLIIMSTIFLSYDLPKFLFGYLLAQTTEFQPVLPITSRNCSRTAVASAGLVMLFMIGLYLGSFPEWQPEDVPYYSWLAQLVPPGYSGYAYAFWTPIGAAIVMFSVTRLTLLRALCQSSLAQYMGKISFSLYITHFWVVHIFGSLIFSDIWGITGKDGTVQTAIGFMVAYPLVLGVAIWIADLFTRLVDQPCIRLASRFQYWMMKA